MIRLYVVVEGQTEEEIVKLLLGPHLAARGIAAYPIVVRTSAGHRGGGRTWARWEEILRWLHRRRGAGRPPPFPDVCREDLLLLSRNQRTRIAAMVREARRAGAKLGARAPAEALERVGRLLRVVERMGC